MRRTAAAAFGSCPRAPTPSRRSAITSTTTQAPIGRYYGIIVLTLEGDRISAITRFGDSGFLPAFGLPRVLRD